MHVKGGLHACIIVGKCTHFVMYDRGQSEKERLCVVLIWKTHDHS